MSMSTTTYSGGFHRNGIALDNTSYPTNCCCLKCSWYLAFPQCLGFGCYSVCCCLEAASSLRCLGFCPHTLCKQDVTCLCIDLKFALPCDAEVPCAVGLCGCILYNGGAAAI